MKKNDNVGTFHDLTCLFISDIENLIDSAMYTTVAIDTYQDILKNTMKKLIKKEIKRKFRLNIRYQTKQTLRSYRWRRYYEQKEI